MGIGPIFASGSGRSSHRDRADLRIGIGPLFASGSAQCPSVIAPYFAALAYCAPSAKIRSLQIRVRFRS